MKKLTNTIKRYGWVRRFIPDSKKSFFGESGKREINFQRVEIVGERKSKYNGFNLFLIRFKDGTIDEEYDVYEEDYLTIKD